MKHVRRLAALAIYLIPLACAAPNRPPPATAEAPGAAAGQNAPAQPHELPASDGPGYTAADVRFMQGMIGHHAQALVMAEMVPTHGVSERVVQLAEKIDISQRDEIDFMTRWLVERDQAVPQDPAAHAGHAGQAGHAAHPMLMPGMLTPEQLEQLDAARGREFDRLFLTFMIEHHRGALVMVDDLFASPGAAQDSDIFRFVTDVDVDQRAEIFTMQGMLDMLGTTPGSPSR